jgi:bifunctional non-homologous end joining protein LigD
MLVTPRPMPLVRIAAPFDHSDWVFELKHDGFRALAQITGHRCDLLSRRRHIYRQFPQLAEELAHSVRVHEAILDGEIVCLGDDGRSLFNRLLFRRDWPYFVAFDALRIDGEDLTRLPLLERKRHLRSVMPRVAGRVLYHDHVAAHGTPLFDAVCRQDLEGIVAKWIHGCYHTDGRLTSWIKVKNPRYSQMMGRRELFEHRRGTSHRTRPLLGPVLSDECMASVR